MARNTIWVVEDPKRRMLSVCRHSGPACWACVARDMERQRDEAEVVSKDLYAALDDVLTTIRIEVEARGGTKRQALARIEVAEIRARAALRRARGGS